MTFDYSKLRGKIVERYGDIGSFAEEVGISRQSISLKLNNKSNWSQNDIVKVVKLLGLSKEETYSYFFTKKVQINEHN